MGNYRAINGNYPTRNDKLSREKWENFRSSMDHCRNGPCVIRSFNFRLKSKIEN